MTICMLKVWLLFQMDIEKISKQTNEMDISDKGDWRKKLILNFTIRFTSFYLDVRLEWITWNIHRQIREGKKKGEEEKKKRRGGKEKEERRKKNEMRKKKKEKRKCIWLSKHK